MSITTGKLYDKIREQLDSMPPESRRECPIKTKMSKCACVGCIRPYNIKKHHLDLYLKGEL